MQKMFDMNLRLIKRQMIMMIPAILLLAAGAKMIYQTTYYSDISDWEKRAAAAVTAVAAAAILFLILYEAHLLFHRTVFGHDSNLYMALPVRTKNLIASKILAVWVQTAAVQLCTFLMFLYPWESQYIPRLIKSWMLDGMPIWQAGVSGLLLTALIFAVPGMVLSLLFFVYALRHMALGSQKGPIATAGIFAGSAALIALLGRLAYKMFVRIGGSYEITRGLILGLVICLALTSAALYLSKNILEHKLNI